MNTKQLQFEYELMSNLERLDKRLRELKLGGLKLWTGILRAVAMDSIRERQRRDDGLYKQLMLLEEQVRDNPLALARVQEIKGLLCVVCLFLSIWSVCTLAHPVRRGTGYRSGGSIRLVMRAKGHGGRGRLGREFEVV